MTTTFTLCSLKSVRGLTFLLMVCTCGCVSPGFRNALQPPTPPADLTIMDRSQSSLDSQIAQVEASTNTAVQYLVADSVSDSKVNQQVLFEAIPLSNSELTACRPAIVQNRTLKPGAKTDCIVKKDCLPPVENVATVLMNSNSCVPDVSGCLSKSQLTELDSRINALQEQLKTQQSDIGILKTELSKSRVTITELNEEIAFWKTHVQKLEQSMSEQHESDIAALNTISKTLEMIIHEK